MPATPTSRLDGLTTSVAVKAPCIATTSTAITLDGEQTVSGFPVVEGNRVLVKDQADAVDNGIYIVSTGEWTRAPDFDGARDAVFGTLVIVVSTDSTTGILYRVTTDDDPIVFGTSEITFEVQTNSSQIVNLTELGISAGNVGDQGPALNAGILALSSAAGGGIYCPPGNYRFTTSIMQQNHVHLWGEGGVTFTWAGSSSDPMFTSPSTGYLIDAGISGINLNCGSAAKAIETRSAWQCTYTDIAIASSSATNFVIDVLCNTSGTLNPDGNRNAVYSYYENILQTGTCGTFVRLRGNQVTPDQVVTLNTFHAMNAQGCSVRGVDFSRYCDSNVFTGLTRVNMIANNSTGVEWNSNTPALNQGVYANDFQHLAVDTFAGFTGRVGLLFNETKYNEIALYYNSPRAEGGSYIIGVGCHSYDFLIAQDEDNGDGKTNALRRVTSESILTEGAFDLDIGTGTGSTKDLNLRAGGFIQMRIRHDIASVNWLDAFGAVAGSGPVLQSDGVDTNISLSMFSKGTGAVTIGTNHGAGGANISLNMPHTVNAVNYIELQQNITGNAPVLRSAGTDANISLALQTKGSGSILLGTNSTTNQVIVSHTASATNQVTMTGSNGGSPSIGATAGGLTIASAVLFSNQTVGTTVGAAGGASALPATPLGYITTNVNGTACKIPYYVV